MAKTLYRYSFLFIVTLLLVSCGTSRSKVFTQLEPQPIPERIPVNIPIERTEDAAVPEETAEESGIIEKIISYALDLQGTKYKYGGNSPEGFDCSGLVYTSFLNENIELPRSSRDMALKGEPLSLHDVNVGDLLFFITDRKRKIINHVGLIVEVVAGNIFFIHSTTSRGVVISSMTEDYWSKHFITARRMI